jgi:hypothetical protein
MGYHKVWPKQQHRFISGFCNINNDDASHRRCIEHPLPKPLVCKCDREGCPCAERENPMTGTPIAQVVDDTTPGFYDDIPEADYHADRTSLSVSGAKVLLKAPALFKWQQDHPVHKDVFDFGSAAHALVLGVGAPIAALAADSWRTKEAKEFRASCYDTGAIPLLQSDFERVEAMADALTSHRLASRLLSDGKPEVSAYALDEATGVMRRGRFDWLGSSILTDYKSAASSEPAAFVKAAANFGYHMQAAWYTDLAADLGHPAEAFAFIAQEKEAPYLVTVIELPPELVDVGRARNRRALERFRDCTESGLWPGYVPDDTFAQPAAPRWALYQEDIA